MCKLRLGHEDPAGLPLHSGCSGLLPPDGGPCDLASTARLPWQALLSLIGCIWLAFLQHNLVAFQARFLPRLGQGLGLVLGQHLDTRIWH